MRASKLAALLFAVSYLVLGSPQRLEGTVKVLSVNEELIFWAGQRVGVKLRISLSHPRGLNLHTIPPQLIMGEFEPGRPPGPFYSSPFYRVTNGSADMMLSVLQATTRLPHSSTRTNFNYDSERSEFEYHLFPGSIFRMHSDDTVCLHSTGQHSSSSTQQITPLIPDLLNQGESLSAYWVAISSDKQVMVDLSQQLTKAIRSVSQFEAAPERWNSMHRVVFPDELRKKHRFHRMIWRSHELCFTRRVGPGELHAARLPEFPPRELASLPEHERSAAFQLPILQLAIETGSTTEALQALYTLRGLGPRASESIPYLSTLLVSHPGFSGSVSQTLAAMGDTVVPWLLPYATNDSPEIRRQAVETLGFIRPGTPDLATALIRALDDSNVGVRRAAAFALNNRGSAVSSALDRLTELAKTDTVGVRHAATSALGGFGAPAVATLSDRLQNDSNKSVRIAAVRSLGQIGLLAKASEPIVRAALEDKDPNVRKYAEQTLSRFHPQIEPVLQKPQTHDEAE